jgi:tripartite ATP-independent transporter DctP family solute receptor
MTTVYSADLPHTRRSALGLAVSRLFLGLGLSVGLMAVAQAQTVMRINISIVKDSHQGAGIDTFAKEVNERSGGRFKIETFYAGSLGGERESIESVQLGTQALTMSSTGPVPNFVPEARILDIPFLFRDKQHARAVLDGPIGVEMAQKFESKGLKVLTWADNGLRHMTNSKREVNSPDDLKGLKMRTMENPVHVAAYKSLGIVTTPMAFPEVFTALQQGTVDGQENPLSVIMGAKFEQVQKHLSLTGHVYSPALIMMNKGMFDKLSAADQKMFIDAAKVAAVANRARVDADDARGVEYLRSKGMQVNDKVDKSLFAAKMAPVLADFDRQFGKENIDRIRNFR